MWGGKKNATNICFVPRQVFHMLTPLIFTALQGRYYYLQFAEGKLKLREVKQFAKGHDARKW